MIYLVVFCILNFLSFLFLSSFIKNNIKTTTFRVFRSLILLASLFLASDSRMKPFVHSEFAPFLSNFEALYGKKVTNLSMSFTNFYSLSIIGICESYESFLLSSGTKSIKIDKKFWDESSETVKEILIFHELGHCVLDRDHLSDVMFTKDKKLIFTSIMNPYIINEADYNENKAYYLIELFSNNDNLNEN